VFTIPEFFEGLFEISDQSENCIRRSRGHGKDLRFRFDVKDIIVLSILLIGFLEHADWNFEESAVLDGVKAVAGHQLEVDLTRPVSRTSCPAFTALLA